MARTARTPKSAKNLPASQRRKSAKTQSVVKTRKPRKQKIAAGEVLPSLLDLVPDENGVLSTNLMEKPPKANPQVWRDFKALVRRRDVVFMRLHKGMTPEEIAAYLDTDVRTVQKDYSDRLRTEVEGDIADLRAMEVARLDDWLSELEPNIRKEIKEARRDTLATGANYRALQQAIKLQAQRIKLLGLERPISADEAGDSLSMHLHKTDITVDITASTTDFVAGVLAAGAADPDTIIQNLTMLTQGEEAVMALEGEELESFLERANAEVDIIDVEAKDVEDAANQEDEVVTDGDL